jgi:hypothetical protein
MKHIRTFESHRTVKANLKAINPSIFEEAIKESVISVGDIYKVRSMVDIPQSLINSYVKKVKDTTGKNLRQFFGDVEIAEELVKHITTSGLDIDKIDGSALMGGAQGQVQTTAQTTTEQPQVQVDTQAETQPAAQEAPVAQEAPAQEEVPAQAQETVAQPSAQFEEPAQAQEGQAPAQEEEEEEEEKKEGEEEEELPL